MPRTFFGWGRPSGSSSVLPRSPSIGRPGASSFLVPGSSLRSGGVLPGRKNQRRIINSLRAWRNPCFHLCECCKREKRKEEKRNERKMKEENKGKGREGRRRKKRNGKGRLGMGREANRREEKR